MHTDSQTQLHITSIMLYHNDSIVLHLFQMYSDGRTTLSQPQVTRAQGKDGVP